MKQEFIPGMWYYFGNEEDKDKKAARFVEICSSSSSSSDVYFAFDAFVRQSKGYTIYDGDWRIPENTHILSPAVLREWNVPEHMMTKNIEFFKEDYYTIY